MESPFSAKPNNMTHPITVRVDSMLHIRVKRIATHEKVTKSEVLRVALEQFVNSYYAKRPELAEE